MEYTGILASRGDKFLYTIECEELNAIITSLLLRCLHYVEGGFEEVTISEPDSYLFNISISNHQDSELDCCTSGP